MNISAIADKKNSSKFFEIVSLLEAG